MKRKIIEEQKAAIDKKVKERGKIQLIYYENFINQFGLKFSDAMERISYTHIT